jgi:predicted RNA-binding protein YlqC (UPF0109 family)
MSGQIVEKVVRFIVCSIVDDQESVRVTIVERGEDDVVAEVRTASGEMGRVIGRGGRVARAIRSVAQAAAEEEGLTSGVEFVD